MNICKPALSKVWNEHFKVVGVTPSKRVDNHRKPFSEILKQKLGVSENEVCNETLVMDI